MEGIAGIVYPDVFQVDQQLNPMLDVLQRRAENAGDSFYHKNYHIGITGGNLAINEKKSIVVALNGNLTNVDELQEAIHRHGHSHGNSYIPANNRGAHTILRAYELWGQGCMAKLSGEFAIAIMDLNREKLYLCRDRIGAKTLYWYQDQHHFLFASQLKALLITGSVPQTPSNDAIASYLYFGYIPQDMTAIKNVNKLLPGHFLQLNRNKSIFIQPFWSYSSYFEQKNQDNKPLILKNLNELITKSISVRLPENEKIGCFISGGLGSASVAYYLSKLKPMKDLYGFSVGFQGQNDPDIKTAMEVVKILGMNHEIDEITPSNFFDNLIQIIWHLDEPLADPNVIALWRMAKMASSKSKTVFSGMGSDELMAGHSRYTTLERQSGSSGRMWPHQIPFLQSLVIPFLKFFYPQGAFQLVKKLRTNPLQYEYLQHHALFSERQLGEASPTLAGLFDPEIFLHKFHNLDKIKSTVASFLYFDVKTRLADFYIPQLKKLTVANNLNWQTPFLDHHLFEYFAALPEPDQLTESETAAYLKVLLKDVYPPHILNRPKRTRPNFLGAWANEPEIKQILPLLQKGTLVESGLISPTWLNVQLNQTKDVEKSFKYLWAVLVLEIWFRLFINGPISVKPPDVSLKEFLS